MGRGAPKGRRGGAAVLRGGAAGATVALARFARQVGAFVCGRRVAAGSRAGEGLARRVGRGGSCAGERLARGVGRGGSCAGKGLARGVPADRGSVSTGHAVSLRTERAVRGGNNFRAAFLRTVTGPRRPLRGETASARSSRPAPLPPPASGQEMAGDRVVSVAGDLPCERMRPRAGVCQSLFLRDWVFLPSSIIILKVTASSNERRSSPMARCTFSSRYTSVLRWM